MKLIRMDSVKNCEQISSNEPNTFLTPTSFARFDERAVARFIKFTQAMNNMNKAIAEKIYTN